LAFIAGATNAGGFLAVNQYTSHISGIVSAMADNSAAWDVGLVLSGMGALVSFVGGAALTAVLVNWGRRRRMQSEYALPLMLEAGLLLVFGLVGGHLEAQRWLFVPATVMLLCFTMGLQNAIITKISHAEIRTTHVTGVVTDIGIELGKLLYWNRTVHRPGEPVVRADWDRLRLLGSLVGLFFGGGVVGAVGFRRVGFACTLPLAGMLLVLALVPVVDDLRRR
jgi:uncharacterized membrane protein YoaK (UPF0700 family)